MSSAEFAAAVYRKLTWRLIPFLFLLYVIAFLDRVNVGYAKLQMAHDLGFSETVYGLGAGLFFIGYFFFEVPSNLVLERVGARLWIARILVVWGLVSAAFIFVHTETQFYAMRFLLGVAEAGFFPGVILYLTYWFPAKQRMRVVALFMTGIALSGIVGGPLSGWIMTRFAGVYGWAGWQWLFLIEGLPAVVLGFVSARVLDNGPQQASWLTEAERNVIAGDVAQERALVAAQGHDTLRHAFLSPKVWLLTAIYFCVVISFYGMVFWLPQLIRDLGVTDLLQNGLLSAIPYCVAAVAMVLNGLHSDRTLERRWHTAIPAMIGAGGMLLAATAPVSNVIAIAAFTIAMTGALASLAVFWSLPTALLSGSAAAAGIALINCFGTLGGFVGPYLLGWIKDQWHAQALGLLILAGFLLLCAVLTLWSVPSGAKLRGANPHSNYALKP